MSVLTAQNQKKTTKMAGIPTEETFKKEQKEITKVATILKVSVTICTNTSNDNFTENLFVLYLCKDNTDKVRDLAECG